MSSGPLLTMGAVREWVGDFEIGKGRPYADAAVFGGNPAVVGAAGKLTAVAKNEGSDPAVEFDPKEAMWRSLMTG